MIPMQQEKSFKAALHYSYLALPKSLSGFHLEQFFQYHLHLASHCIMIRIVTSEKEIPGFLFLSLLLPFVFREGKQCVDDFFVC